MSFQTCEIFMMKPESFLTLHSEHALKTDRDKKKLLNTFVIFVFFAHKKHTSWNYSWTTDVTWIILSMSLLHFWVWELGMCNSDWVLKYSATTAISDHESDDREKKKKSDWL